MEILIIISILLFGLFYLLKKVSDKFVLSSWFSVRNLLFFLLIWICFGFYFRLENTDALGCLLIREPIWDINNIRFSLISLILISSLLLIKKQSLKQILIITELSYWIFKLVVFKGGYAVGFGAMPSESVVFYDFISIITRFFLCDFIFSFKEISKMKIGFISFLIMSLKISLFPTPLIYHYYDLKTVQETTTLRNNIIGNWKGSYVFENNLDKPIQTEIEIDSTFIIFNSVEKLNSKYYLTLDILKFGNLSKDGMGSDLGLIVEKITTDSLILNVRTKNIKSHSEWKIKLKRDID